jgi:hypothetical protein
MQNRYVGDIGDYLKLGILRALSPGHRLGVAWWLYPDEHHNRDGRHVGYLQRPDRWRHFDPELFDALAQIVAFNRRDVRALETTNLVPNAIFANEFIPIDRPASQRKQARSDWLAKVKYQLTDADIVFVDPDNGFEPSGFSHGSVNAGKSVMFGELLELMRPGRSLIVYHHHTRRAGGHLAEIAYWADRLCATGFTTIYALRARPYSPRAYFLLNAPPDVRERAEQITAHWEGLITWHQDKAGSA